MTPTIEEVKRVAGERNLHKNVPVEFWFLRLQAFAQHWIEVGKKEAYRSNIDATHECIYCYLRYTPEVGDSEDCPNCGCDGTSEWVDNAIRNNTGE